MTSEPRRKGKHFTRDERAKIETLRKAGHTHQYIADFIGCCRSAITKEIKKGQVDHLDGSTYLISKVYDAYAAQQHADYRKTAHSKGLKLGNNHAYARAIAECIELGYSPYAAIRLVGTTYGITVTKQTMYRYIAEGLIPGISYKKLPVGHPKKRKHKVEADKVIRSKSTLHRSIELRSKDILSRLAFGHWEIDSIIGRSKGDKESCLVITERTTRQEIVIKVPKKNAESTIKAMHWLKRKLGKDFNKLFLTITSDNGCEFADQDAFDLLGVPVFYCHPHAPHERGSNENNNKLLRRKHFPKGESMKRKTQYHATQAQHFINSYPREKFGGKSSNDLFRVELEKLNLANPQRVYKFFNL